MQDEERERLFKTRASLLPLGCLALLFPEHLPVVGSAIVVAEGKQKTVIIIKGKLCRCHISATHQCVSLLFVSWRSRSENWTVLDFLFLLLLFHYSLSLFQSIFLFSSSFSITSSFSYFLSHFFLFHPALFLFFRTFLRFLSLFSSFLRDASPE